MSKSGHEITLFFFAVQFSLFVHYGYWGCAAFSLCLFLLDLTTYALYKCGVLHHPAVPLPESPVTT